MCFTQSVNEQAYCIPEYSKLFLKNKNKSQADDVSSI